MKYDEISYYIKNNYSESVFFKETIASIIKQLYNTDNEKTIRNIIGILKSNNIIKEIRKNEYVVVTKKIYEYKEAEVEKEIYDVIKSEYSEILFTIWNTAVINEFTQHYTMDKYIVIEVEKIAIEEIINLIKRTYANKYTIITQDIFNNHRELYIDTKNLIIVKPIVLKAPLNNNKISIEKLMVDLYVDKLYIQYQGKELQTIYENIFEKYDIELKRLLSYAELRTKIKEYIKFLNALYIPEKYKVKE